MSVIARFIDVDLALATEKDLQKYVATLERSDKKEWTKHDHKFALKKFYKWTSKGENPKVTTLF